jgi:D-inositol-3-phosphate glycosyltransferase
MRISIVGPVYPYRSGIAHFTAELARILQERGHQIQLISFRRQYPALLFPGKSDRDSSQVPVLFPADYHLDPFLPWTWQSSARQIAGFAPQAVIIPWWTTYWAPSFWSLSALLRKQGRPVFYLIHNVLPHESKPWDTWLTRQVLRQGRGFILLSRSQQDPLLKLVPRARTVVSPHPAYTMFSHQRIPIKEARQILELPDPMIIALFFGIIRPYKGLSYTLEAIAELHHRGIEIFLLVAGEFWENKAVYLEKIRTLQIQDNVRIEDRYIPNEEVARYFSAADLFLAPYTAGTQSGASNLAIGFGLPIITTERISQGLNPDATSISLVPPGDSQALADAIERFARSPSTHRSALPDDTGWDLLAEKIETLIEGEVLHER